MRILNGKTLPIHGFLITTLYTCFLIFIGYSAARQGLSSYFADAALRSGSEADAAVAIRFLPDNPYAHQTRAEIFLRKNDYALAAAAYEEAIRHSPNDFLLWLRLGYSRSLIKDFDASETAFQKALELAPNYIQPHYYMGQMLLEAGRTDEAFRHLSKAAARDHELYPQLLRQAQLSFSNDPCAIERSLQPTSNDAKKAVALYFIENNLMTDNIRSFLAGSALSDGEKNDFVQYLLHKGNFEVAREVWLSRLQPEKPDSSGPIFDGGFEAITQTDPSGLGWQINQEMTATAVTRDRETFRSGTSALKVRFAGNVETGKDILSQFVYVQPRRKYKLRVFIRSKELISAGPPAIVSHDGITSELLGRSDQFGSTSDEWVEYQFEFAAKDAPVVRISIQRIECNSSPCPIFGELYLDDFELIPLAGALR